MDFRRIYPGGEPRISNPDLMFMQYSNYYAMQGVAEGLDKNGVGVVFKGCDVTATYNHTTRTGTANIANGYLGIKGQMVKVENTSSISIPVTYTSGPTAYYYVFAEVELQYNSKGDKVFEDSTSRRTWEENRIKLSYSSSSAAQANKVLVASLLFDSNAETVTVSKRINDVGENLIEDNNIPNINTTGRASKDNKVVTGSNLYDVMGDWTILKLSSSDKEVNGDTTTYTFTIPEEVKSLFVIGARCSLTDYIGGQCLIGMGGSGVNFDNWFWQPPADVLYVNFLTGSFNGGTASVWCFVNYINTTA